MSLSVRSVPVRHRWSLLYIILALSAAGLLIVFCWPQILLQSVLWQKTLHREMTALLQQVATQPHRAGISLLLFSLAYGVLHALGPGHGKVVISAFLATHPAQMRTSLRLTLLAALLQGGVAIGLVTLMLVVLQASARQLHLGSYWLEKGSYLLVIALGLWLGARAVRALWRTLHPTHWRFQPLTPDHQHNAYCGCGDRHVPDGQQLTRMVSVKTQMLVVLSMGLRPCSGAIMMLLFAKVMNVYLWGVAAALVMAAGTGLTVSALGIMVVRSRLLAESLARSSVRRSARLAVLFPLLMLLGALLLTVAGIALWQSASPAASGGLRPF